jgi:ABC-type branched-subunit amino acid transport system substrate-binding protein
MRSWRFAIAAVVALVASPPGQAQDPPARAPAAPPRVTLRLGALLPLTGPGAWFGAEIKQGIDLAVAELDPSPRSARPGDKGGTSDPSAPTTGDAGEKDTREKADPAPGAKAPGTKDETGAGPSPPGSTKRRSGPPPEPIEPPDRPRTVSIQFQALDVQPLDLKAAETEVNRLLTAGVVAVVTASPTPTLTVYPIAASRDALVLHAGLPTDRFPARSRTLFQLRPSPAARAEVLAALAWERSIRRPGLLAGGDAFGRAIRTAFAARWRQLGGHLVHEESLSLEASDRRSRLRAVTRAAPEAMVLGYQGAALGEAASALRDAGYTGQLLAVDDDRAALLAGGRALDGAMILADAFVPVPGTRGARFARSYEARHEQPPSRFAATAYETVSLLVEAVRLAAGGGSSPTGTRLREALVAGQRFPSLYAGDVVVRDDGTVVRPLSLFRVEGDRLSLESYVAGDGRALSASPASDAGPLGRRLALSSALRASDEAPLDP